MRVDPPEFRKVPLLRSDEAVVVEDGAADVVLDMVAMLATVRLPVESRSRCGECREVSGSRLLSSAMMRA